jgi:polyisoprenoid-binding protein YceI
MYQGARPPLLNAMLTLSPRRTHTAALPEPGLWSLDSLGTRVAFSGRAHRFAPTVRAEFTGVSGTFAVAEQPIELQVEVVVEVATMTTGNPAYDEILARVDPLESLRYPWATYRGQLTDWDEASERGRIMGALILKGVQRFVDLDVVYLGRAGEARRYRASSELDWRSFGIAYDLPGAALLVPKQMRLDIDITALPLG